MKVLHIAQNTPRYEVVELLANRVNRNNSLSVIRGEDGQTSYTGGYILEDTPVIRDILDKIPPEEQYEFVQTWRTEPFAKFYYEEETA